MKRKLTQDAFTYYVGLGPDRSYSAVAKFFQVDKRTVVARAKLERWQEQLATLEKNAQAGAQKKLVTTLEEMNERHLKVLRAVLGKALETLRALPLKTAADAVRAIDVCVKHERVILGEPSERTAVNMEDLVRREYERWLIKNPGPDGPREADTSVSASAPALPPVELSRLPLEPLDGEADDDDDA